MSAASVVLAAPIKEIGDHLLSVSGEWGEKALMVVILVSVVIAVGSKMSVKAGIGALIGLVVCVGIYQSRDELAQAFKEEITNVSTSTPASPASTDK
ncbi:hypothetical protein ACFTUC_39500 [Streptomyces sp. NPDC056944]|uniref:hypothetical protein n=1 Tax=unclassified Streptomyces TaxID=2593676 RepID=UPI0036322060